MKVMLVIFILITYYLYGVLISSIARSFIFRNNCSVLINWYFTYTLHSRITNASWLLKSFGNHIFYANHDIEYPNEDFFADQVNLVCEDTQRRLNLRYPNSLSYVIAMLAINPRSPLQLSL